MRFNFRAHLKLINILRHIVMNLTDVTIQPTQLAFHAPSECECQRGPNSCENHKAFSLLCVHLLKGHQAP
jgi:hypothetical protein